MTTAEVEGLGDELEIDVLGMTRAEAYAETERHILERRERVLFAEMKFTMARPGQSAIFASRALHTSDSLQHRLAAALVLCFVGAGIWWRASSEPVTPGPIIVASGVAVVLIVLIVARFANPS